MPEISNLNVKTRKKESSWEDPLLKSKTMYDNNLFYFHNQKGELIKASDWSNSSKSKLWLYHLHYLDDLNSEGWFNRVKWHEQLLDKWIEDNSFGESIGWDSYPISIRVVNIIKWSLNGNVLKKKWEKSIFIQAIFLKNNLEYDLLGNHLLANAKCLIFCGAYFTQNSKSFLQIGIEIFKKQLAEQILEDGGHFERSPMYHGIVTEDVLDIINLTQTYPSIFDKEFKRQLKYKVQKMILWYQNMNHTDGLISFFNDSSLNNAIKLKKIIEYAARLGIHIKSEDKKQFYFMEKTGYVRISQKKYSCIVDVGEIGPAYQSGHAHADTFSFEFSINSNRIIVNSGTSTYENNNLRLFQRSTSSHSTVEIDKMNSSEVWHCFRTARRRAPENIELIKSKKQIKVKAEHRGYHFFSKNTHRREWIFSSNKVCVNDMIKNDYESAISRFYFHPFVKINCLNNNIIKGCCNEQKFTITTDTDNYKIIDAYWYPEFGIKMNNKCLVINYTTKNHNTIIELEQ